MHITDGAIGVVYQLGLKCILKQLAEFDAFDEGNDPYHEHDFGSLSAGSDKGWWKIDYYAPDLESASEDPTNQSATTRVMTIMTPEEY